MSEVKTVEQIDAEIAKLNADKVEMLKASKETDLATVKKLCKLHGFTATNLRSYLGGKNSKKKNSPAPDTETETATVKKSAAAKKVPAKKR